MHVASKMRTIREARKAYDRTDLAELADRLRTAAEALKHPSAEHSLSAEEKAALCREVKTIAAELRRDWHIEAFADWRARK
jgi:hypothetical protein